MKTMIAVLSLSLLGSIARAETVTLAKAAELTCHRIERLVTLKKIPDTFLNRLYSVQVQAVPAQKPTDPAFRSVSTQVPNSSGQANQLELFLDSTGKALDFRLLSGPDSVNAPVWPDKDPVTLIENSLHYLLDNAGTTLALQPFLMALSSVVIAPARDAAGNFVARAEMRSTQTRASLEVVLKADGTFSSAQVIGQ